MAFLLPKAPLSRRPSINRFHLQIERHSKVASDSLVPLCWGGGGDRLEAMAIGGK